MATVNRAKGRLKKEEPPHPMDYMFDALPREGGDREVIETIRRYKTARDQRARGEPREDASTLAHPAMHLPLAIGELAARRFNQVLDRRGDAVLDELAAAAEGHAGGVAAKLWEILARPAEPSASG